MACGNGVFDKRKFCQRKRFPVQRYYPITYSLSLFGDTSEVTLHASKGVTRQWFDHGYAYPNRHILVPFPWGREGIKVLEDCNFNTITEEYCTVIMFTICTQTVIRSMGTLVLAFGNVRNGQRRRTLFNEAY